MVMEKLKFKDIRPYISKIDPLSICMKETLQYENYSCIDCVDESYDEKEVFGIGLIESEVLENGLGKMLKPCIEIVLL